MVAEACQANLNKKLFFYDDISSRLEDAIYHSECPVKETYNTASLSLSASVRSKGIKVILSGEGADELFAGYVGYRFDKLRAMDQMPRQASPREESLREQVWGDPHFFYEMNFSDLEQVKKSLYSADLCDAFREVSCLNHHIINKRRLEGRNMLNKRSYIDYKLRLVDHLVSDHGDRMALANSVEVRYPFLDKDLAEFSTQLPSSLKLNDFTEKYILKRMASRFVPSPVVEREKFGFVAPGSPYLLQKNIGYINDLLSYDRIKRQGYFNADYVESLKKTYRQNGYSINVPFENDLLIIVITFGIFLDKFLTPSTVKANI
jgi:asparagine synthase (glutamine-hydrolysing)